MGKKARLIVSTVLVIALAALAWPLNVGFFSIESEYSEEQISAYKKIRQDSPYRQKITLEAEHLKGLGVWLDPCAPGQEGSARITLKDAAKKQVFSVTVPLSEIENASFHEIKIGKRILPGRYRIEIEAVDCGQDYFRLGMFWNEKGKKRIALSYQYGRSMNGIQTIMYWMLLFELWLAFCWFSHTPKTEGRGRSLSSGIGQAAVIMGVIALFCFSAALSPAVSYEKSWRTLWPGFLIWGIFFALVLQWKSSRAREGGGRIKRALPGRKQLPLILLLVISALVRIPMLGTLQRWDAGEYYYRLGTACENFQFSLQSLLDNFRLCSHSTMGFSLIAAIGEFLSPRDSIGVLSVSLILTLLAIFCLFYLLRDAWLKCSSWLAAGFALAISFTPIFLGTFAYVNPDYFLAVYVILLLYCDYREWNILAFASAVLVSQCKETGVPVIAGYYGLKILGDFVAVRGGLKARIRGVLNGSSIWIAMAAAAVYEAMVLQLGSFITWTQGGGQAGKLWSNTGSNCFGFNVGYIVYKMKQFLCVNFAWVISIMMICSILVLFYRKSDRGLKKRVGENVFKYTGFLGAMAGFTLFSVLYITSCLNRYNILFTLGWSIAGMSVYYYLAGYKQHKLLNISVVSLFSCLFFVQAFWNIDIVSSKLFSTFPISDKNTILNTIQSTELGYYGDGLVNNYQYAWMDQALNKFLREIEYDSDKAIFCPEKTGGVFISGNPGVYTVVWDKDKQKRVFPQGNASEIEIRILGETDIRNDVPKDVLIPIIRYYYVDEEQLRSLLEPLYDMGEKKSVTCYGGEIEYYHAVRRDAS